MANTNALTRLTPWNWFRNEENALSSGSSGQNYGRGSSMPVSYFGPLSSFYRDIDRMFENVFNNFSLIGMPNGLSMQSLFRPNVDIAARDDAYTVTVEAPGLREDDIRITLSGDSLVIRGEKQQEKNEQGQQYQRSERMYGSFQRVLTLPEDVEAEDISATCENGLITITLPRREQKNARTRQIEINAGGEQQQRGNRQGERGEQRQQQNEPRTAGTSTGQTSGSNVHPKRAA